jgi:hypothetical protein
MFTLSLDLIEGAQIRATTLGGVTLFSAIDFVAGACGVAHSTAKKEFGKLAVSKNARMARFPGVGQRDTPVLTVFGLERLLGELGDKVERARALQIETGLQRLRAGDSSSLKSKKADAEMEPPRCKRRRVGPEDGLQAVRTEEARIELEERRNRVNAQELQNMQTMLEILERVRPGKAVDAHTAERIEVQTTSILLGDYQCPGYSSDEESEAEEYESAADAPTESGDEDQGLRIGTVAKEMKLHCTEGQLKEIGKRMAAKYKEAYNAPPPKQMRRVGFRTVDVNTYTERDRDMMEGVIRGYMNE